MSGSEKDDERAFQEHLNIAKEGNKGFPPLSDRIEYHHEKAKKLEHTPDKKPASRPKKNK